VVAPDLARLLEIPDGTLLLMGQTGMDQGSATADLTLSINWADEQKWSGWKQFRQLSFSDRMRQQWLEKSSIRHVDILSNAS